jgi:hypothetical protein
MLTSDDYANLLSDSTQLVSAREASAGQRGIWRLLARRLRTFGQLPASRAYVEFINGLSASEYADLAGAYLANGFVHYGTARPARARALLELHFTKATADTLEDLPVLRLLRTLRECPGDVLNAGENVKSLFLRRRGEAVRALNNNFGIASRQAFVRNLIGNSPEQFAAALVRYQSDLEATLDAYYMPYEDFSAADVGSSVATAAPGRGAAESGAQTVRRHCSFSPATQSGAEHVSDSAACPRSASARPTQVSRLAISGPFVNTSRNEDGAGADGRVGLTTRATSRSATPTATPAGIEEWLASIHDAITATQTTTNDLGSRLDDMHRHMLDYETGVDAALDRVSDRVDSAFDRDAAEGGLRGGAAGGGAAAARALAAADVVPAGASAVPICSPCGYQQCCAATAASGSAATAASGCAAPAASYADHQLSRGSVLNRDQADQLLAAETHLDGALERLQQASRSAASLNTSQCQGTDLLDNGGHRLVFNRDQAERLRAADPQAVDVTSHLDGALERLERLRPAAAPATPSPVDAAPAQPSDLAAFTATMREWMSRSQPTASAATAAQSIAPKPDLVAPSWLRPSNIIGLAHAACKVPDISRVQEERPAANGDAEQLKAAMRQLHYDHPKTGLLRKVPPAGNTAQYVKVRSSILESWAVYRFIVSAVPEESRDGQLLSALIDCAIERSSDAAVPANEQYRWRTLEKATSIDNFLDLLDQLYADSADNLVEDQWAAASADLELAAGDLYYCLVPLMVDSATIKRGKALLLQRLARDPLNRSAMSQLRECRDTVEALHTWGKVFADLKADSELLMKQRPAGRKVSIDAGAASRSLAAFGDRVDGSAPQDGHFHADMNVNLEMSQREAAKTFLAIVQDRARQQGLPPPLRLDDPSIPGLMQSAANSTKPAELTALAQAVDALTALVNQQGKSDGHSGGDGQLAPFGPGQKRTFKPIFDLPKIYAFLGIPASQLPPAKPGCSAADGGCKICVLHGITEWVDFQQAKGKQLQPNQAFDHNSYKCPFVEAEVNKAAAEKGTPAAEVADLLTPLDSPPWRVR